MAATDLETTGFEAPDDLALRTHLWKVIIMTESCLTPLTGAMSEMGPSLEGCAPASRTFRRGDADRGGPVNIADPSFILNWRFIGGPPGRTIVLPTRPTTIWTTSRESASTANGRDDQKGALHDRPAVADTGPS